MPAEMQAELTDTERQVLGSAWGSDLGWEFLTELIEIGNRMGGHPGEHEAATLVADHLRAAGARDVTVDSFAMTRWNRGTTDLAVTTPVDRSFEAIALPYSPAGDIEGALVDVGAGTPEEIDDADVEGKIALASSSTPEDYGRFIHRMEKYGHAAEAGAIGFIFHNHVPGQLPPTGSLQFNQEGSIPGIGVSKETGHWLLEYADRGGTVALTVEASVEPAESYNAHGVVGPDTDEEVVIVAHHDAHDIAEGGLDNGSGIATAVAAAQLLGEFELQAQVRIAGVGSEEIGLIGADQLAATLDLDRVKAVLNLDGAGRFRDMTPVVNGSDPLAEAFAAVSEAVGHPIETDDRTHPFSDHWPFVRRGVPATQVRSDSGERGRGWGHTHADTRDKADRRNLQEHAMLIALTAKELAARDPLPRLDSETVADALREGDLEEGMRAAGIWPDDWN
ncbi:MAG: M28 family metallopeptidase [Halobacteriales archaeon]|nr:M28 family metallopeptidase [Halobacteriales archaeon]